MFTRLNFPEIFLTERQKLQKFLNKSGTHSPEMAGKTGVRSSKKTNKRMIRTLIRTGSDIEFRFISRSGRLRNGFSHSRCNSQFIKM